MFNKTILFFYLTISFFVSNLDGCSTFLLEKNGRFLLAKSYDWIVEDGLIVVNKRSIAKQAMTLDKPMQWISKYGSIIFTQAGRELPMGGMNEAGLVIELMWLDDTTYPLLDSRFTVNELQWIQYQLDTASTVEEVIASNDILRIDIDCKALIHFMIADKRGNSSIVEFINGQMVVHPKSEMLAAPVLTNNTYQKSIEYLSTHEGFGGDKMASSGFRSLDRFVRIATLLQKFSMNDDEANLFSAFQILASVANYAEVKNEEITLENITRYLRAKWNIVYDVADKKIHFLTASHKKIRTIQLDDFNFEGNTSVQVLDMQAELEGDVHHAFIPYTYDLNRNLIERYYNQVPFLKGIPEDIRDLIARYPENCVYIEDSSS